MASRLRIGLAVVLALVAGACDKMPLFAPTNSTVTLTTAAAALPVGGTTEVTAFVAESSGTPVQNGTTVRFTTNLGTVQPVDVQTTNGYAVTTFLAGDISGVADVRATSGSAGSASGGDTATNVVQIAVIADTVDSVVLSANPASLPVTGGSTDLLATVIGVSGSPLGNVPVTFTTSAGQLAAVLVYTDGNGQARTTLTTDRTATITASAVGKTSNQVTVSLAPAVTATLTATAGTTTPGVAQSWTFTAAINSTDPTVAPVQFNWNFGDGAAFTTNSASVSHVYTNTGSYNVSVTITLLNGQSVVATTGILVVF